MVEEHDFERTIALGERSLSYLKQFRSPAIPRNYELCYAFAAGYNKSLSTALMKIVAQLSRLPQKEADTLYQTYIAPYNEAKLGPLSNQMAHELGEIVSVIEAATERTGLYGTSLKGVKEQLHDIKTPAQLKGAVETLVQVANDMAEHNARLERRLAESKAQIEELHQSLEQSRAESMTDQLTGLGNRKRFDQLLDMEILEANDTGDPLCLALLDIDHFKSFNDTFGHQTGDQVLRLVSRMVKTVIKGRDHAARYGGEEFAVILPKTKLKSGITVAEHIRNAVKSKELVKKSTGESLGHITVSIGLAAYKPGETVDQLVHRADCCLYAAKKSGRDQVKCDTDPGIEFDTEINAA
ncbi:MAG: GGDEF domain-containing protein [Hyphomicrobiales bacterium]